MIKLLKKWFHRHDWQMIDQTPLDYTQYHCVYECKKCKKRKAEIIDISNYT